MFRSPLIDILRILTHSADGQKLLEYPLLCRRRRKPGPISFLADCLRRAPGTRWAVGALALVVTAGLPRGTRDGGEAWRLFPRRCRVAACCLALCGRPIVILDSYAGQTGDRVAASVGNV